MRGAYWIRPFGGAPRFRRPFTASNSDAHKNDPYAGLTLPAKTDVALALYDCSNNGIRVIGRFDVVLISTTL